MRRAAVALALAMPGSAGIAHAQAIPHLTPHGYGPARIGMTRAQVERAIGTRLEGEALDDPFQCIELFNDRGHVGLIFMFERDRLTRITITEDSRATTPAPIEGACGTSRTIIPARKAAT